MNTLSVLAILFVPAGIALPFVAKYLMKAEVRRKTLSGNSPDKPPKSGYIVLGLFTLIALVFGILTLSLYWTTVMQNRDLIVFGFGLFLVMVLGMFAQVIVTNYAANHSLLSVSASQLIFPLLLSPIVFYVVWSTAAAAPKGYFVIYCAFLNGYFWESTVSKVKPQGE